MSATKCRRAPSMRWLQTLLSRTMLLAAATAALSGCPLPPGPAPEDAAPYTHPRDATAENGVDAGAPPAPVSPATATRANPRATAQATNLSRYLLWIDELESWQPVEHRPFHIKFTLCNPGRAGATSGWVGGTIVTTTGARFDTSVWDIVDLGGGACAEGVLHTWAPDAARGHLLNVYFYQETTYVAEFRVAGPHLADAWMDLDTAARFFFSFDSFHVHDTRSAFTDTLFASFQGKTEAGEIWGPPTAYLGDHDSGDDRSVGLEFGPVDMVPDTAPLFEGSYALVNRGHREEEDVRDFLDALSRATATVLTVVSPGAAGAWEAAHQLTQLINGFFFKSCDGPVAAGKFAFGVNNLLIETQTDDEHLLVRHHGLEREPEYEAGDICGPTTHYEVRMKARRLRTEVDTFEVSPTIVRLPAGQSQQFATNMPGALTWFVEGGARSGFIDGNGRFWANPTFPIPKDRYVTVVVRNDWGLEARAYVAPGP
jgi:hypothetical protein